MPVAGFEPMAAQVGADLDSIRRSMAVAGIPDTGMFAGVDAMVQTPGNSQSLIQAADGWDSLAEGVLSDSWNAVTTLEADKDTGATLLSLWRGELGNQWREYQHHVNKAYPMLIDACTAMSQGLRDIDAALLHDWQMKAKWGSRVAWLFSFFVGLAGVTPDHGFEFDPEQVKIDDTQAAFERVADLGRLDEASLSPVPADHPKGPEVSFKSEMVRTKGGDLQVSGRLLNKAAGLVDGLTLDSKDFSAKGQNAHRAYENGRVALRQIFAAGSPFQDGRGALYIKAADDQEAAQHAAARRMGGK